MKVAALAALKSLVVVLECLFLVACSATPSPTRAQLLQLPSSSAPLETLVPPGPSDRLVFTPTAHDDSTLIPSPTLTLVPGPQIDQLTNGGCCSHPFWSIDSRYLQFIDRPAGRPLGIYGVDVEHFGRPALISEQIIDSSGDGRFYVYPEGNTAVVQQATTGEKFVIPNGGRRTSVSPAGDRLLWQVTDQQGDFDRRRSEVWVADIDGSNARVVAETMGSGTSDWIDSQRVLLAGMLLEDPPFEGIAALALAAEPEYARILHLAQAARPQETLVSPAGNWVIFLLSFQENARDDGLWIVPTNGNQISRKLSFFGSYHWRDDTHLLYVPMEVDIQHHELWEYDVLSGESRRLVGPEQIPFQIANNDWAVSPNGRYVAFSGAVDHNLWLIDLSP